jgi:hypothetical protein
MVIRRAGNARSRPKITLPLVQLVVTRASVKQQDARSAVNEPSSVECLDSSLIHAPDSRDHGGISWLDFFDFDGGRGAVERAQQGVHGAILGGGDLSFRLEHAVDSTDSVGDLGSDLEEHMVAHVAVLWFGHCGGAAGWRRCERGKGAQLQSGAGERVVVLR